ncbi:Aste57867_21702 [Aphanomyces stellatus]|uniref:Aste57867_21702 protein n=1 Tax=Aphanomyces stellatus TaxID=120398 RepID=A0A485LI91_9STRA|nr:hypothetical protein As57867_021633 [Aphanomyces stellatus]VFT98371.1 Aste57867_21702 [Aphanomyces stellatus]
MSASVTPSVLRKSAISVAAAMEGYYSTDDDSYKSHDICSSTDMFQTLNRSVFSSCRSDADSSESDRPTEPCSVMGRVTTLWSKCAVALNDIDQVHIVSHVVLKDRAATVVYTFDLFLHASDIGLADPWAFREPHYQLQHRYSDCRTLRLHLVTSIRESLVAHPRCNFCATMRTFLASRRFPKRCPNTLLQLVPAWRAFVIERRKSVLQEWFNQLLTVARNYSASQGSASVRCDGFVNVMYILKEFLLDPTLPRGLSGHGW